MCDDLLWGLDWFIAQGRVDEALRLASALVPLWISTARLEEGAATLERVLSLSGGNAAQRARALEGAGHLRFFMGDDERARMLEHQTVALGRTGYNFTMVALALPDLARTALRTDIEGARCLCRDALAVTKRTGAVIAWMPRTGLIGRGRAKRPAPATCGPYGGQKR